MQPKKLIRITTVPLSLKTLLKGQLKFMSENGFEVIAISSDVQQMKEIAQAENVRTFTVEMTRKITPVQDLKALYRLIKIFKKEKPDIVHTHTPKAGLLGMMAARIAGVPHRLHTVAGLPLVEAQGLKRKILNLTEKITYACAHQVYPNSYGLQNIILQNKFCIPQKLHVIGTGSSNGINTQFFNVANIPTQDIEALKNKLNIPSSAFVFVFVGRIVTDKGINELVAAFTQMSSLNREVKLVLVGPLESDLDPLLPATEKILKNNKNIISVGLQKDVRPYFALADALVFPSYREGFPNVVMQAGAMELPCIVSDINGCNEIIQDGKNGNIVPVKNAEKLQAAMHKMVEDKNWHKSLKANARPMITSRYEQQIIWQAILKTYQTLLNS